METLSNQAPYLSQDAIDRDPSPAAKVSRALENEAVQTADINWYGVAFLVILPILTLPLAIWTVQTQGFSTFALGLMIALWTAGGLAITAGYHRLFAHKTYQTGSPMKWFSLLFGAMTVQNSALIWASDHRFHHQFQDTDGDPYNINRGFYWAHFGWMMKKNKEDRTYANSLDLKKDAAVMFQHNYYAWVMPLMNFGLPTLIGALAGRAWEGFLWGGLVRMTFFHHCTFLVNSAAHYFGKKNHSQVNTARDSLWVSILTFGEGYHSFHHAYPADHRIGHRWHHYDPGKWLIRSLRFLGMAQDLKVNPKAPA